MEASYDYVIVGAGTAGCALARLLSDADFNVLILEAGTNNSEDDFITSPSLVESLALTANPEYTDTILSVLEVELKKQLRYAYGRVWGGSSSISAMLYVWGSPQLYEGWARRTDSRWNYQNVRRALINNETYTGSTTHDRGHKGPVSILQIQYPVRDTMSEVFVRAVHEVTGVPVVNDYNAGYDENVAYYTQYTHSSRGDERKRESSATAYLGPEVLTQGNEVRPDGRGRNLLLLSKCTVNKVLFASDGVTARDVLYTRNGITQKAKAQREIILCAGAMTPTILQRSGIGDRPYLESLGIKCLVDNPNVGAHLKTHNAVSFAVEVATSRIEDFKRSCSGAEVGTGVFGQAFLRMGHWHRKLQILPYTFAEGIVPEFVVLQGGWQYDPKRSTNLISFFLVDLEPKSEGSVRIKHSDPDSIPEVQFHAYADPRDLEFGVRSYQVMYDILQEMKRTDPEGIYRAIYPSERTFASRERAAKLEKYVRITGVNFYHYASQCRMGTKRSKAVVDPELRVFGVQNLRVADLCVCPIIPDGNTEAAAFMIGRQAARFILEEGS